MASGHAFDEINGTMVLEHMRDIEFLGMTGNVTIDSNAEREGYSFPLTLSNH